MHSITWDALTPTDTVWNCS